MNWSTMLIMGRIIGQKYEVTFEECFIPHARKKDQNVMAQISFLTKVIAFLTLKIQLIQNYSMHAKFSSR